MRTPRLGIKTEAIQTRVRCLPTASARQIIISLRSGLHRTFNEAIKTSLDQGNLWIDL